MKYLDKYIVVCKWVESYENPIIFKFCDKKTKSIQVKIKQLKET